MSRTDTMTTNAKKDATAAPAVASAPGHGYTFEDALTTAQRVNWRIDDIIGGDKTLDFGRPFMPESLARVEGLDFLTADEKRTLNQIRGNAYLTIFGLVEEFILPFVLDHARPELDTDDWRTRALLQFAGEEAKHIHLFKRFREEFEKGFGTRCEVIGPPAAVAQAVLAHDPLGVALAILHIEWMTQRHYVESIRDDGDLDPQFKSLLKHHWMEEAQHAKLDTLMVEALSAGRTEEEKMKGVEEYLKVGLFIDAGLENQTKMDMDAFMRATGRKLTPEEQEIFLKQQHQANRWTYLGTGLTHPRVLETLERMTPAARKMVEEVGPAFC